MYVEVQAAECLQQQLAGVFEAVQEQQVVEILAAVREQQAVEIPAAVQEQQAVEIPAAVREQQAVEALFELPFADQVMETTDLPAVYFL